MNRRDFITSAAAAAALAAVGRGQTASPPRKPNLIFILADDLGYADLSSFGRTDYKTPVLDQMVREGLKFTDNYTSAPVCTPTRCAYMTGRYPQRLAIGLQEPLGDANMQIGLPPTHPTIATQLKLAGYDTALIGKWHLGNTAEFGPNRHGFDEFFGIEGSSADYFTHANMTGRLDLYENLKPSDQPGYLTDLFSNRAVDYIARPRQRPFFLSLQYNAPHWPWEGPEDKALSTSRSGVAGGTDAIYASMVRSMDTGIGRVFDALRKANLEQNTLVVFTSDNGGERFSDNRPFKQGKFFLWEGGLRVPAIARFSGVIPAGRVTNQVALTMDWSATLLEAAGAKPDAAYPFDGESIWPVCTGKRPAFDRTVFWKSRLRNQDAVRMGRWKYLRDATDEHLFDLDADPGESTDLRIRQPELFQKLRAGFKTWEATMTISPGR